MLHRDKILSLYRTMLRIRMVEEKIADLYSAQEMRCPVHLCIGQEAVPAGVCANMTNEDYAMSNHRSHGHYLAKGGDLKAMMAELYGKKTGCSQGKGGSMHLVDLSIGFLGATPIVGSTIPIAVGVAFGSAMRNLRRISAVFFGDAAVEEGVFHESLNFAVLKKLPVLFVCENNMYSVNSPLSVRQPPKREIVKLAEGHSVKSYQGDGNNVIEVYELTQKAVGLIRQGAGPVFLEFKTYRWREHCGPNYDHFIGIRPESELQKWKKQCPIEKFKKYALKNRTISQRGIKDIEDGLKTEIEEAVKFAKKSDFPNGEFLMKDIYAE